MSSVPASPLLTQVIGSTFILAYKEDTTQIKTSLTKASCQCEVLRQIHQPGYERYSRSYLCLLNHRQAWERALHSAQPTLVVEADFVPVKDFGQLPPPFDPADPKLGIAWLYTCAPQIYTLTEGGYAQGYSTAMVAYVVTAQSAQLLVDLAEAVKADPGPETYTPWDSGIEYYLRDR
ncbi:MAG: LPS biosynthesis glycosyltransferase, partial [Cyanobacteria bacterium P01_A01_bin.114]